MARVIQEIQENQVLSVYSGIDGRCCCGCSGKHTYNPLWKEIAQEDHGGRLDDEEFSSRSIKIILNKIKKASNVDDEGDYIATVTDTGRLLVAYLVPSPEDLEAKRAWRKKCKEEQAAKELAKKAEALEALKGAGI